VFFRRPSGRCPGAFFGFSQQYLMILVCIKRRGRQGQASR